MTKKMPKDQRMGGIVKAALDEFMDRGYEGASMDSIAARAGLSKGGLYHHFQGKDDILLYANQIIDRPLARLREEAAAQPSAKKALADYIRKYLIYWKKHQREMVFYSLSMTKILDNPALREMYSKFVDGYLSLFESIYRRGIETGEFLPHTARDSALALAAALDGVVFYIIMSKTLKPEDIAPVFYKKFIDCLTTKEGGRSDAGGEK